MDIFGAALLFELIHKNCFRQIMEGTFRYMMTDSLQF